MKIKNGTKENKKYASLPTSRENTGLFTSGSRL